MNPENPDIYFELQKVNGLFQGKAHFNLLKSTQSLNPTHDFEAFLQDLRVKAESTFKQVAPLPGRSSADVARFTPKDTLVHNDPENPLTDEEISRIKTYLLEIEAAWYDLENPPI